MVATATNAAVAIASAVRFASVVFFFAVVVVLSASIANVATAAVAGDDADGAEVNAPFREGVEYMYEWQASVQTGPASASLNSGTAVTATRFMGQLIVLSSRDTSNSSNWRVILKLKNVSVAVQHGGNAREETAAKWIPAPAELDSQLTSKPFYLLYSSSQVVGASFPSGESVWSANFKRSFASVLQLHLPSSSSSSDTLNNRVYSHQELTLNGRCDAQYYIKESTENNGQWIVQKDRDLESCRNSVTGKPESAGRWRTFVQMSTCSSSSSSSNSQDSSSNTGQRLAGATSSTRYVVAVNRGHPELLHIESSGSVWLDPFGILQSAMKSTTTLKMHLEKTRRSSESTGDASLVFADQLRFAFGTVQQPVDLKAAQNLMLRAQPALMSSPNFQEQLRRKSQLDLLNAIEALPSAAASASGSGGTTTEQQRLALSSIAFQLGSLDYTNAKALFRDLSVAATNEKLVNAKNLMLDLLLHSGSNVGIILLRDLVTERAIDEWTAARLVAYAGAYVKEPSEALVQAVQQMQNKDFWPEAEMFHRSAVLAVSSIIGKSCSASSSCTSVRIQDWQKKYLDIFTASGSSFAEKGLYVHALHNIGYGTSNVLDALLEFAAKTSGEESANDLRCYVIKGLAKSLSNDDDNYEKVWNVLVALVRDSAESFRVRIEAAKALLGTQPTARAVQEMRRLLLSPNEGGLGDGQVRHYVTSAIRTIAESRNPCNRHLKEMARDVLDALPESVKTSTSSLSSSEFSYDFLDDNSQFGSQLNMRTVYSEFDDMPGFVDGKVLYYVKGSIVQPYSFTLRGSGMRRYITSLSSSSWRESDLNTVRFQQTMDTFQFASRKESAGTGADVAFTLHGTTVMFYHMDKIFLNKIGQSATSLDFLQDLSFNFQRYATAGALLYTQPDGLGLPVSFVFSAPLIIGIKGSMTKTKVPGMIGRHIQLNLYGQIDGDQGILSHPMEYLTQGVVRNRKAAFHVPLNVEMNTDIGKLQMDFTYTTPKLSEAMEINSVARTILTLRPSSPDFGKLLAQTCPGCHPIHLVKNDNKPLITETIVNASWPVSGIEAHAQIFECDQESARNGRIGGPLGLAFTALNPAAMNHRSSVAAWAYLSFLRLQHHIFIQPEGNGQCGYRGRVFRSTYLPVKEMITRLRLKQSGGNDEVELSLQSGKISLKAELIWKGETSASDRKGEIDIIYEYRNGGHRNTLSVRAVVIKSQLVPDLNKGDVMVCLKAESTIQSPPTNDVINIDGYTQPVTASAFVEYVMGFANSQQCPTNQTRFKLLLKAQAGQWVMERRQMKAVGSDQSSLIPTYYAQCQAEKNTGNWAQGQTPQTDNCYRTAVDFTTLSNYQFEMRSASLSARMEKMVARLGQLGSLMMLPYWEDSEAVPLPPSSQKDVSVVTFNISFHPTTSEQDPQLINLSVASGNGQIEKYKDVKLAFGQITLPSTSVPRTTRIAYENNLVPSCLVTSQYVRSLDKVMLPGSNHFTPCYTIVSSDCGTSPLYAVFVRRTTGQHPLAVKVLVGGHTIEILPDESGRRKELIVRANDIDVDIVGQQQQSSSNSSSSSSFTLPEGRDKQFYVLKVRYQAPLYIITSPGAGLLVHYSGSHVAVFPTWFHKNQHCGLCGNFDGEPDAEREWSNPQGCLLQNASGSGGNNVTQLVASYTLGTNCFPNYKKFACN